jgi:hypothetical protein
VNASGNETLLSGRLDALEQNLRRARASAGQLASVRVNAPVKEAIESIDGVFERATNRGLAKVDAIRGLLGDPSRTGDAWKEFRKLERESDALFAECLEIIGGLSLRESAFDDQMCEIADAVIQACALESSTTKWDSMTVVARHEPLAPALTRIVRLRFPEWTIWSLPLTAHEYGHVIGHDPELALVDLLDARVATVIECVPELLRIAEDNRQRAETCARTHLHALLADAFGTYVMGPAYACAAIRMRLNPSSAFTSTAEMPAHAARAHVVLAMLTRMSDAVPLMPPYGFVISTLSREWQAALDQVAPGRTLPEDLPDFLDELVEALDARFAVELRATASYPTSEGDHGWPTAQRWANIWERKFAGENVEPEVEPTSKLRDVLNAAWICRLTKPQIPEATLVPWAVGLCRKIMERRSGGGSDRRPPENPAPREPRR